MSKKSRKLIRATPPPPEQATPELLPEAAIPVPELQQRFYFLPDTPALAVHEKELHDLMKVWRHGRATRTIWEVLQDGYVALFTVVLIGAMVVNVVLHAQSGAAGCSTQSCASARLLMPTAMVFLSYAFTLSIARLFGPVLASAAEGFWLMDAPISRRRLLRGRMVTPVVIAGALSAVLTALSAALVGMDVASLLVWTVAAGLGSSALMAWAAAEQGLERVTLVRLLLGVFGGLALAVLLGVVSIAAGWLPATGALASQSAWWIGVGVIVAAGVGLAVALRSAGQRLERIRRARLVSGGSLVSGMQGAMFALDFGLIRDILVEREAAERGHVRPTKGRGLGVTALIWRDVERLKRNPKAFIALAVSLVVPYAGDALRMSQLNPLISAIGLFIALVPFLGSLRVLTRTGGLARALPFKTSTIRTAAMAVPAALALLWAVATTPAFIGIAQTGADRSLFNGFATALVTGVAGLFGAVRWVTGKKVDFAVPMMATESGAMPPTLLFNLVRGFDMAILITAPLILQQPVTWSLAIAGVVFVFLRGTFNMAELTAEQEAMKRQEAAAKAAGKEKVKIVRPAR
ncbi:MAG: ABC transporter permease [Propionibacteriaceae bacterium]|nr:ABC transporter permease [Propionibacteriaceae bacterium]